MDTAKKTAILTFDYELFLGRKTGTLINSVVKPATIILNTLRRENAKAIFFVDAVWLLFLKKTAGTNLEIISVQLREIIRQGSSVQLHIHPQWINAAWKDNITYFETFRNYNLQSFSPEEILDLFRKSIDLLEGITMKKICCFRAGGHCIEPFSHVQQAFETFNIRYDFSMAPGIYLKTGHAYDYDFRGAPDLCFYRFQDNLRHPDPDGRFCEFPLSTYDNNPVYRFYNLCSLKLRHDKIPGDGEGIQKELSLISRLVSKKLGFSRTFLTLDQVDPRLFKYILRNCFGEKPLIVINSHPKTFSAYSVSNLSFVTENYNTANSDDLDRLVSGNT